MFIYPNSTIKFLQHVPLDKTYENTIYFETLNAQYNYFNSKVKPDINVAGKITTFSLNHQMYSRQGEKLRVKICADYLYNTNYIMFQNTSYSGKWFYAFVKSVKYINNEVSEVDYEIDVMQTWFFDYQLEMCFVEREHSSDDNLFEHFVDENIDYGNEYFCSWEPDTQNSMIFDKTKFVIIALLNGQTTQQVASNQLLLSTGYYMPCLAVGANSDSNGAQDIFNIIDNTALVQDPNDVIAIYQCPGEITTDGQGNKTLVDITKTISIAPLSTITFEGYTPKNNKLYCAPYNILLVSNNCGGVAVYKYEYSNKSQHNIELTRRTNQIPTPSAIIIPKDYRGLSEDWDSALIYDNFPVCGWVTDTYKCWWAQNKTSYIVGMASGGLSGMGNVANGVTGIVSSGNASSGLGGIISGASSIFSSTWGSIAKQADIAVRPNQAGGQFKCDVLNLKENRVGFNIYNMRIKKEYAMIIDDFFTKYGYACKQLKYPNRKSRSKWTFVKTKGCTIKPSTNGGYPCDEEAKICQIYDTGITFWYYSTASGFVFDVGNYNQNNTPTNVEGG